MTKYVLMQNPTVPHPDNRGGYYTIGLRKKYPGKGYFGCDELGITPKPYPFRSIKTTEPFRGKFAFADKESQEAFKGEVVRENGIFFAIVKDA